MDVNLVWAGVMLTGLLAFGWTRRLILFVPLLILSLLEFAADGVFGSD